MKNETTKPCSRLVIVMEGDMIQSIISDNPESAPEIAIVEYCDTYGDDFDELRNITQGDGSQSLAYVTERYVEEADIDLDDVFLKLDAMDEEALHRYLIEQQIVTADMTMLELSVDLTNDELISVANAESKALAEKGFGVGASQIYSILELLRDEAIREREYFGD